MDSFTVRGVGQLRADSVLLGHQRLERPHGAQGNAGAAASNKKVQPASVGLQDGLDDGGGVSLGCLGCLGCGSDSGGGSGSGSLSWRSCSSAAGQGGSRGRAPGGPGGAVTSLRQDSDSDADEEDDAEPAVSSALRSLRSSLVGWGSRMRLRLLGGSSRLVLVDGVPYTLRAHLKTNKPKRSALRSDATTTTTPPPHSVSCPGCVEHGQYGAASGVPGSPNGTSPASTAPYKKRLRFALSVMGDGDGGGSETDVDALAGTYDNDSPPSQLGRGKRGGGDGGDAGSGSDDGGSGGGSGGGHAAGGASGDAMRGGSGCGVAGCKAGESGALAIGGKARVEALAPFDDSPPPAPADASSKAVAAAAAGSGSLAQAAKSDGTGGGSISPSDAAAATAAATAAAAGASSPEGSGRQSSSFKLLLRGGPSSRSGQVHPDRPPPSPPVGGAPAASASAAVAGSPTERGFQQPTPPMAATSPDTEIQQQLPAPSPPQSSLAPQAAPPPSGPADAAAAATATGTGAAPTGGAAALAIRPPSLLARLLLGARGDPGPATSNSAPDSSAGNPGSRNSSFRADAQTSAAAAGETGLNAAGGTGGSSGGGIVNVSQQQELAPRPGRYMSAQVLRSALFEPEPATQQPLPPPTAALMAAGGGSEGGGNSPGGALGQRTQRVASYTAPGLIPAQGGRAAHVGQMSPRALRQGNGLDGPSAKAIAWSDTPEQQQQQKQRLLLQEGADDGKSDDGGRVKEADERCAEAAAAKFRLMRSRQERLGALKRGEERAEGVRQHSTMASAPQWSVTSVRPIGGGDVRDTAAGDDGDDDVGAFSWLDALRKTRSMTGLWSVRLGGGADGSGANGDGAVDDDDAEVMLSRLGRGSSSTQSAAGPRLAAACPAPAVRAGRRANGPNALDMSFSDLSSSVQRAVQAVQGNTNNTRVRLMQPKPPPQQQRPSFDDSGADFASAANVSASERSRQIRAAPFAAAMGLLRPPVSAPVPTAAGAAATAAAAVTAPSPPPMPSSAVRVRQTVSDRSGAARWQLPQPAAAAPLPPPSPPTAGRQQPYRASCEMPVGHRGVQGSSTGVATSNPAVTPIAATEPMPLATSVAGTTATLQQADYVIVPESPSSPPEPMPHGSGTGASATAPASAPAAVAAAAPRPSDKVRAGKPGRLEVPDDSDCGGSDKGGGGSRPSGPLAASPFAAAITATMEAETLLRRPGAGAAVIRTSLGSPSGLSVRPPSRISVQGQGRGRAVGAAAAPTAEVSEFALSPLNTPAADLWADERTALAGSGTPFADIAPNLAQALAARLEMTSSGVNPSGTGSADGGGGGSGRAAQNSHIRAVPYSAALGLLQQQRQQQQQNLRASGEACCPSSDAPAGDLRPAAATAAAAVGSGHGSGGNGGGYAAARAAAQREAMRAAAAAAGARASIPVVSAAGIETKALAAAVSGSGDRRGGLQARDIPLPGGIELVGGGDCRSGGGGGARGAGGGGSFAAANGITAGGAVLSHRSSLLSLPSIDSRDT